MSTRAERPSSTFRDLARALSEDERRSLLQRISQSLSLKQPRSDRPFRQVVGEQSRSEVIAHEIAEMGFWQRVRYFIRRLFSAKNEQETYLEFKLAHIRRRARYVCPRLGAIEHHSASATIADRTWELYRVAYPTIPLFHDFWKGGEYWQESVEHLLEQRVPGAKSSLYDLVRLEELQEAFFRNELKGDVRKLVVDRLGEYLQSIPDELLARIKEGLLPFYHLRQIGLFEFNRFFEVFGFNPGIAPPEETPPFRDAPASAALPVLESLYYALHSAGKIDPDFYVHSEIIDRYLEIKERRPDQVGGAGTDGEERSEREYRRRKTRLEETKEGIRELHQTCRSLARAVPFADLIRYYTRDPWLRIKPYVPELNLREFYRSYLMIRLLGELDSRFPEIRRGVADRMTRELFDADPPSMSYFRTGVQITPEKGGFPTFLHMRSLTVAYSFLRFLYRGRMQEMVRILSRILPVRQRDSSSDLIVHVSGTEAALADIEDFDRSFSPETEDGKAFYHVRYAVESDVTMQRSYRNLVQQRDREAAAIVDKATEHISSLARVFETLERDLTDQVRERYAAADHRVNSLDGLDRLLREQRAKMEKYVSLIRQVRAMEEGY
ncbi:MAG: DUF5312 family protein [Spirochaetota bacterium]